MLDAARGTATRTATLDEKGDARLVEGADEIAGMAITVTNSSRAGVELGDSVRIRLVDMGIDELYVVVQRSTTYTGADDLVDRLTVIPARLLA